MPDLPRKGGHSDDPARVPLHHARCKRLDQGHRRTEIDREDVVDAVCGRVVIGQRQQDPRIIHEDINMIPCITLSHALLHAGKV